jgi:hypothetical protein
VDILGRHRVISIQGQISLLNTDSRQTAHLDDGVVVVSSGGTVTVSASADRIIVPTVFGVGVGLVAAGAAISSTT